MTNEQQLKQLLRDVAELNDEQVEHVAHSIVSAISAEPGSEEWLKEVTQQLADHLTSLGVNTPGLKIGEIMRKLQGADESSPQGTL